MDVLYNNEPAQESNVRSYSRVFPAVFSRAQGAVLCDEAGNEWLDFLSGAGALNYGHNHPTLKAALLRYIEQDGVVSSLDLHTSAKHDFLAALGDIVLKPRGLDYRCQFCGPTGTNTVEAAIKLARKATGRKGVISFSNSFHGMSTGAMSASASFRRRKEQYLNPDWVTFLPFDGFTGMDDELSFVRAMLTSQGSGINAPAAFIVELVQGEGGVNIASTRWVQEIRRLAKELGAVFIVDEIQSGCGRTGRFFSFEHHDIVPDLVCVSKSISGLGLPMGLLLINPELDVWAPGEHNGTFRGFNYAFVTAAEALRHFWADPSFVDTLAARGKQLDGLLKTLKQAFPQSIASVSHMGMIAGVRLAGSAVASTVQQHCFDNGLIVETCGPDGATLKLMPPINIGEPELEQGLSILHAGITASAP
ncbi:diaminobutyrate--2-oxoglutarate transaminase [Trinickia fusca]|uniref:Diaminobutyrate--2-oxoglutarate transaminase n=1 Tax=Trinickia fusca TaxID=2419777 RepID=A0A494XU98_9BURK|nr:diaminobutyrate--2-oxoglutarate transaminase [Trinickia fusca]RKP52536.1 diaminobutyrate--2-oxoglutarate transaminase [Trinickia fusca]